MALETIFEGKCRVNTIQDEIRSFENAQGKTTEYAYGTCTFVDANGVKQEGASCKIWKKSLDAGVVEGGVHPFIVQYDPETPQYGPQIIVRSGVTANVPTLEMFGKKAQTPAAPAKPAGKSTTTKKAAVPAGDDDLPF